MSLSVAIQAGGESKRMGRDKAGALFLGEPLLGRACRRLAGLGDDLFVTTHAPQDWTALGVPCHPDVLPGRGALGGLYTALLHARQPLVAVVACDMPFASAALLRLALARLGEADVALFESDGGREPLHAVYRRASALPAVRAALEAGLWRVDVWFDTVRVRLLRRSEWEPLDPTGRAFLNVNTPAELAAAEALARSLGLD